MSKNKNAKMLLIAVYLILYTYIPLTYFPESVKMFDFLYSVFRWSESSLFTFIGYWVIFATFMLFFCFWLKENVRVSKVTWIYFLNVIMPVFSFFSLKKEALTLIVLMTFSFVLFFTMLTALKITNTKAKEETTEV